MNRCSVDSRSVVRRNGILMVGIGWHFHCQNVRIDASKRKHANGHSSLYLYGLWAFLKKITESSKQGCFGSEDRCSIQLSYGRTSTYANSLDCVRNIA